MRDQLQALVSEYGYQLVLHNILLLMVNAITPKVIGYDIVWGQAKDLNKTAYDLDRVNKGEIS